MIYVLKIIWDYRVPLLELIVRNIARYPQSATSTSIRYQPAIRYLLPFTEGFCIYVHCRVPSIHNQWRISRVISTAHGESALLK
jgi:hypothetical protein